MTRLHVLSPEGHDVHREECPNEFCRESTGNAWLDARGCSLCDGSGLVRPVGCHCSTCAAEELREATNDYANALGIP